jgi:hypothetical protein
MDENEKDWAIGQVACREWESEAIRLGFTDERYMARKTRNIGALVRLVREIPYLYDHGSDLPDHQERIAAWLAEARALVGEGEP